MRMTGLRMTHYNPSPSPVVKIGKKTKAQKTICPNLAQTYKECVRQVYDVYAPNLWRTHSLDRKRKITSFRF